MEKPIKFVKALKQKVTMMTLPKKFCTLLNINAGDNLEVTLDIKKECMEVRKRK